MLGHMRLFDHGRTALVLSLFGCCGLPGQVSQNLPAFDVASVRVNNGPPDYIDLGTAEHGQLRLHGVSMKDCIRYAYGLVSNQQISAPDWTESYDYRFEIVAKTSPDTPESQIQLMLRRLLAERFHLALHQEQKPIAHLDLEVAKGGMRLPLSPVTPSKPRYIFGRALLNYTHQSMEDVAVLLSRQLKQTVVNRTGLAEFYDVKLQWRPEDFETAMTAANPALVQVLKDRPELEEALAEVGLKLTGSKSPIRVVVVDRVDRTPVEN
jgi:uncharacterized protein (TIGR03435 family)